MGSRMLPIAVVFVVLAALSGCAPDSVIVTPNPQSSATPVFASDEEALAAATEAYAKYVEATDQIAQAGGQGFERMAELVTEEQYKKESDGFNQFRDKGIHLVGSSRFDSVKLQSWSIGPDGIAEVNIYVCSDASDVRVESDSGLDVTPTDRPERSPFEIGFTGVAPGSAELLLSRSELWTGNDFC